MQRELQITRAEVKSAKIVKLRKISKIQEQIPIPKLEIFEKLESTVTTPRTFVARGRTRLVRSSGTDKDHKSLSNWLETRDFACCICDAKFFHKSAVEAHMLTHTGTLPRVPRAKRTIKRTESTNSRDSIISIDKPPTKKYISENFRRFRESIRRRIPTK